MPQNHPSDSSEKYCKICNSKLDPTIMGGSCQVCLWSYLVSGDEDSEPEDDIPIIDGYEILEQIGSGGMGIVYRALQLVPAREVALKIVAPYTLRAKQARQRFMVEVEAMAAVEHPCLLPLYDAGEDEHGRPWLTMQLAHGGTLGERADQYKEDWKKIARLLISLANGVQYAHERGILHRDLKPANILFDDENHPYIADFGLAKWADGDSGMTQSSYLMGSPAYLAPETAEGGSKYTTTVSDVYGLGAILYELLCGSKPYEGTQAAEILTQILVSSPISPKAKIPSVPRDLEVIVLKAMAREPEKRYDSASAFADDLQRWIDGKMILARPVGKMERALIWAKRNPALTTLSLLLLTSLITGGILLWKSNQELTVALNDAEHRVEFMTRELPAQLEPIGRLDLLDDVFRNVSEHYVMDSRTDSASLARHADFLTQWSQILRPRGQVKEAIVRLDGAVEKADAAINVSDYSVDAARARILAGRRLGEALIEDKSFERARSILSETIDLSAELTKNYSNDIRLNTFIAELYQEMAILEYDEKKLDEALKVQQEALALWEMVVPSMKQEVAEQGPNTPHFQKALMIAARGYQYLYKIQQAHGNKVEARKALENHLQASKENLELSPSDLNFDHELVMSRLIKIRYELDEEIVSQEEAMQTYVEVDAEIQHLVSNAPSNIRWQTDYASIALNISHLAKKMGDGTIEFEWMEKVGIRMEPLYKLHLTDLSFLYGHRGCATQYALYFKDRDWDSARLHFLAAAKIQIQICTIDPTIVTHRSLQKGTPKILKLLVDKDGNKAATDWLMEQLKNYQRVTRQSTQLDAKGLWKWSTAASYRRLLEQSEPSAETLSMMKTQLDLLLSASDLTDVIPELNKDTMDAVQTILESPEATQVDQIYALSKSIVALENIRQATKPETDLDKQWLELIIKHTENLPLTKRQSIIDLALKEFFTKATSDDPLFQQLQQLRTK